MVGAVTSKPTTGIKFDNVTVGGNITDKHTGPKSGSANARVGGLIAEIGSDISSSPNIVKIQSVSVNTLNVKTSTKISGSTSGGFIGHNWYNVEVTLDKIIVSNSTITSDSNEIGGLVLSTTGYWSIKKVSFDSVTVTANNCKNLACSPRHYWEEIMIHIHLIILMDQVHITVNVPLMQLILNSLILMDMRFHKILR